MMNKLLKVCLLIINLITVVMLFCLIQTQRGHIEALKTRNERLTTQNELLMNAIEKVDAAYSGRCK